MARSEAGLTQRSTGAPTAGHQARAAGTRYILCGPGLASSRCRPVSSTLGGMYAYAALHFRIYQEPADTHGLTSKQRHHIRGGSN